MTDFVCVPMARWLEIEDQLARIAGLDDVPMPEFSFEELIEPISPTVTPFLRYLKEAPREG